MVPVSRLLVPGPGPHQALLGQDLVGERVDDQAGRGRGS